MCAWREELAVRRRLECGKIQKQTNKQCMHALEALGGQIDIIITQSIHAKTDKISHCTCNQNSLQKLCACTAMQHTHAQMLIALSCIAN